MKKAILVGLCLVFLGGCRGADVSDGQFLSSAELVETTRKAERGDIDSVRRLIKHYEPVAETQNEAAYWRAKARSLKDPHELGVYALQLWSRSRQEPDRIKRRALLVEALQNAVQANEFDHERNGQDVINMIQMDLWQTEVSQESARATSQN